MSCTTKCSQSCQLLSSAWHRGLAPSCSYLSLHQVFPLTPQLISDAERIRKPSGFNKKKKKKSCLYLIAKVTSHIIPGSLWLGEEVFSEQLNEAAESTSSSSWVGGCGGEQHQHSQDALQAVNKVPSYLCVSHIPHEALTTHLEAGGPGSAVSFAIKAGIVWQAGLYLPLS